MGTGSLEVKQNARAQAAQVDQIRLVVALQPDDLLPNLQHLFELAIGQ
jgi:hypothetical protein